MPTPEISAMWLDQCPWPIVWIDCARCSRHTAPHIATLQRKFGKVTLGEAARQVAAPSCALARDGAQSICSARPVAPPIDHWALLDHARRLGYRARLHCHRHLAAMKSTRPCPTTWDLDLESLIAVLGYDFPLDRLPPRLSCPDCHTKAIRLEWIGPPATPGPSGASAPAPVLQLRPTKAVTGRVRLKLVRGGRG